MHDVVTAFSLRLGSRGDEQLIALRGDVVDLHLNVILDAPLAAERGQRAVSIGDPMVPGADPHHASSISVLDIGRRDGGRRPKPRTSARCVA